MTTGLIHFIQERLTEDEQSARKATPGPWVPDEPWLADWVKSGILGHVADCSIGAGYRAQSIPDAAHISRHNPMRALAEVEAKRRILGLHSDATGHSCSITDETGYELNYGEVGGGDACTTLRLLALPFTDHPDFREEWRP